MFRQLFFSVDNLLRLHGKSLLICVFSVTLGNIWKDVSHLSVSINHTEPFIIWYLQRLWVCACQMAMHLYGMDHACEVHACLITCNIPREAVFGQCRLMSGFIYLTCADEARGTITQPFDFMAFSFLPYMELLMHVHLQVKLQIWTILWCCSNLTLRVSNILVVNTFNIFNTQVYFEITALNFAQVVKWPWRKVLS